MTAALDIGRSDQHIATLQAVAKAAQDDARLRDSAFQLHRLTLGGADVACLCNANASPAPESVLTVWPDGSVATVPYDQVRRAIARSTPYALDTPVALKGMQVDLFADPDPDPPAPAEQKPASLQAISAFANQTTDPTVRDHIAANSLGVHDIAYAVVRLHAYATAQAGSNEDVNSLIQRARETLAIYNRGDVPAIPELIAAERRGLWDPLRTHIGYSEVARHTEEQRANQALIDKHGELFDLTINPGATAQIVRKNDAWWVVRAGGKAVSPLGERDSDAGIRQRLDAANAELISRGPYLPQEEITTEDVLTDTTPKVPAGNVEQQAAHRAAVAELKRRGVAYNSTLDRSAMLFQDTHGADFVLHLIENNQRVDAPVAGDEAGLFGGDRARAIEWAASWLAGLRNTPTPAEAMGAVQEPPSEPTPEPGDSPASYLREQGLDVKSLDSDTIATLLSSASLPQRYDLATWLVTQRPDLREAVDAILLESSVFDYPEEPRAEPYYNRYMNVAERQAAEAQFHQDGAVAFELPDGRLLSIHPSAKHPGQFQSTTYDALSATGDLSYHTLDEAVRQAIRGSKGTLLPWAQAEPRLTAIAAASYITADRAGALYDALPASLTSLVDIAEHVVEQPFPATHSATEEALNMACHVIHWLVTDSKNSPATATLQNASREAARAWLGNLVEQVGRSHVDAYRRQIEATFEQLPEPSPTDDNATERNAAKPAQEKKPRNTRGPRIEDFGEKIGGARKDEEYERRLSSPLPDDIKDITLSKHFPEPNYQKLINDGYDAYTLALIKACRDEIPSKPRRNYKLKTWGEKVASLREIANDLLTKPDFAQRFKEGIVQRDVLAPIVDKARLLVSVGFPEITDLKKFSIKKTSGILEWKGEEFPSPGVTRYVVKEKHLWRDAYETWEEAAEHIKGRLADAAKKGRVPELDVWQWRNTGEVVIGKKVAAGKYIELQGGFSSVKHARAYLKVHHDELQELLAAKKKLPPWRGETNRERVGIDHRNGVDVTGEQMQQVFGFRGGEYGNYVEQSTRQAHLNGAYDALMDLSLLLGMDPKAMSLNGELAIAFGARGRGRANAHYEHEYRVINLTKNNGPGSLAHEWFHAMDWLLANQSGVSGPLTETSRDPDITRQFTGRQETLKAFLAIGDAIRQTDLPARCGLLDITRTKNYYGTMRELAARCFEHYIHTRLQAQGHHNDYLVNILDLGEDERSPFPHPNEISMIHGSFDNLLNTLQQEITDKGVALFRLGKRPQPSVDAPVLFSPVDNAARPLPVNLDHVDEINRVVQDFQNETQLSIKAVWDVNDLPYGLRKQVLAVENADTAVRGAYWNNTLYIVRRNHTDAGDVLKTLLHEGLAHYGLRRVFGAERVDTLMDDIYTGLNDTQREAVNALALAAKLDLDDRDQRRRATEEYVAHLAEHDTEQTLMQRVVGRVREWLRELGWLQRVTQHTWTDNDITTLLRDVRRNLRNTPSQIEPREPTTANTARFRLGGRPQAQIDELGFYSPLENAILSLPENSKGRPDQLLAQLRQAGAKQAEIQWLGLPEYLAAFGRSVNKQQLLNFVAGRGVQVQPLPALPVGTQQLLDFAGRRGVQVEEVVKRPIPWRSINATWNETSDPDTARRLQRGMPPEARIQQVYANPDTGYHVVGSDDGYFTFDQRGRRIDPNHFDNYGIRFARQPQREFTHFADAKAAAAYHRALQTGRDRDFAKYTARSLPGGTNHREVLLTLQADPNSGRYGQVAQQADGSWQVVGPGEERQTFATHLDAYDELYRRAATGAYTTTHWPADHNVIAHVRLADHLTPSGERVLVINELQSDWNNAKRPGPRNLGRPHTPDMPFTGNAWAELAIKRVLRLAAEEGYTRIAWTTGDTQLARANLGKPLEEVFPQPGGDNPGPILKGKGLLALYDQIVPNTLKKMVRSLDPNNPAITTSEVVTPPLVINREWLAMMRDAADNHLFELSGHNRPDQEYQWQTFKNAIDAVALPASGEWTPAQLIAHLREYDLPDLEALGLGDLAAEPPPGHTTVWSLPLSDELRRQARQGLPLFRFHDRAPVNPRHWPDIERLIGDFQAETGIPIVVVAHTQDLPEPLRQQALEAETENTAARGAVWSGRLYLVRNNHADAADALATLLHEGVAHYGLRRVFGAERVDTLMDEIYSALSEPQHQALAALAHRAQFNMGDLQQRRRAVEEYVANIAERGTEQTLMQRVVGRVREWLREMGWLQRVTPNTWSDNDITTLLSNVRRTLPAVIDEATQALASEPLVQGVAENTAVYAPGAARIADAITSPGPSIQGDLFLMPGANPEQKQQQLTDIYHVLVAAETVDYLNADVEFIHAPEDLARLVGEIGQRAQEVLLAVVTDDEGGILRVIKHSSGTIDQSAASPLLIAAEAASIEGAATVHLAHNHPSGDPTPSYLDKDTTQSLADVLDGTNIALGYHVVIGADTYHAFDATDWQTVAALPPQTANRAGRVAVTERRFSQRNPGKPIDPSTTIPVVADIDSDHAVLLLDMKNQPVGVVFLSAQEMSNLRQNGNVNRLLRAIHATNASAAILKSDDEGAVANMIHFFNRKGLRGFRLLDWIDLDGTSARREAPEMLRHEARFFSRSQSTQEVYDARINALFADGQASRMGVKVLDSADVLGLLGYDNRPVHIAESKVIAGLHNHPLMTAEHWRRVPEWLENPVAVFDSDTVPGRLVFIAPEFIGTAPITLIVDPNATVQGQPVTLLLNAYERGTAMPLSRWLNEHKLRYIDNEKIPAFNSTSGRQLPRVYRQTQGSRVKVYTDRHLVKFRQQKRSQATGVVVNPHTPASLRAELERAFPGVYTALENNGLARIVTAADAAAKKAATGQPGSVTRAYVERGTLIFIADHIPRGYHIAGLMLHEIGVHLKQLGKDDGEFQTLLQAFEAMCQAGNAQVMAAFAAVPGNTAAELVTEEALGHYLEQNSDQPFAQKVFTWLRAKLREWANVIDRSERFAITRWANRLQENDLLYLATTAVRSSLAAHTERSPTATTAPATGEHSADAARLARGEAMGFDTQKVWYHGGFEDFAEFSPAQSGSGVYHFAESAQFADDYARSRAFHEASDADVVVRGFHLPKQLFDFANPEHIEQLRAILPEQLAIESKYGLNALAGPVNYSNAELLKAIQGIQTPYTPITADVLADIAAGNTELWLEGRRVRIIRCDHDRGEVQYVPVWQALQLDKARHEWQRVANNPDASDWDRSQAEEALEHAEKVYRITTDPIAPAPRGGYDNWEILESEQLRPYLRQLGFEGCLMQEKGQRTACVFDPHRIRLENAAFDPRHQHEPNLLFRLADHDKTPVPGELTEDEKLHYLAAIAQGVDVSETARLKRARQMGFDTDTVWYHGSPNGHLTEISEWQTSYGLFFARDPETARYYTGKEGRLYAVYLKAHNVADLDDFETFKKIADNSIDITETRDDEDARHFGVRLFNEGYQKNTVIKAFFDKLEGIEEVLGGDYDADEWLWHHDIGADEIEELVADIGLERINQQFDDDVPINRPELDDAWNVYQSGSQNWYQFYQSDFLRGAQQLGYDAVDMADPSPTGEPFSRVVFEPSQIRSVNALFEREFSDEPELMYRLADNSAVPNNLPLEEKLEYLAANAKQLDLSYEARMQRARSMGFDTTTTWYHGTGRDFAAFEIDPQHKVNDAGVLGAGVYFSSDPTIASTHANLADPYAGRVIPAYLKIRNPLVVKAGAAGDNRAEGFYGKLSDLLATFRETYPDADYRLYETLGGKYDPVAEFIFGGIEDQVAQDVAELLTDFEHDAVLYEFDDGGKEVVVFDPSQIRSVNAAFDPDFSAHADLLFRLNEQTAAEHRRLAEIERAIDDFLREVDLPVVAVSRTRDLPAGIRNAMKGLKNADTRMQAATYNGVIYLVKENHSDADDVRKTLLHEGVAHYGLRKVFGHARVNALMDDIYAGLNDEQRNDMRAVAIREQLDINNPDQRRTLTEEYVAYIAESGIEQTLLQKALATVRQWARELGWVSAWSDNDIKGLLRNTHRQLRKDTWRAQHNQPAEKPASLLLNARTAAAQPLYRQRDNLAFDDWFKHSQACDRSGKPLVVYRGQHGEAGVLETRHGSLSFSSAQRASRHALAPSADPYAAVAPHVLPVHLAINNPLVNQPDNPFIDGATLVKHVGTDRARVIALRFDHAIRGTEVWQTHYGNHGSVADLLKAQPEAIDQLQIPARLVLDDPAITQWLKNAGCDGAIYGVVEPDQTITPEYRVFDDHQVRSALDPDQPFAQRPGHHPFVSAVEELGYFSVLHRAAQALPQEKGTPAQMLAMLKKAGVKDEELEWTDVREYLATQGERVTKQQIVDYVAANGVQIQEIVKSADETHKRLAAFGILKETLTEEDLQFSDGYKVGPSEAYLEKEAQSSFAQGEYDSYEEAYEEVKREAWDQASIQYDLLVDGKRTDIYILASDIGGTHEYALVVNGEETECTSLDTAKRAAKNMLLNGNTRHRDRAFAGGKNYREILFTLPDQKSRQVAVHQAWEESGLAALHHEQYPGTDPALFKKWLSDAVDYTVDDAQWAHNGGLLGTLFPPSQVSEAVSIINGKLNNARSFTKRTHWEEKNVLAHARITDRIGIHGEKILFVEEVQSDWHMRGRHTGYQGSEADYQTAAPYGHHFDTVKYPEHSYETHRLVENKTGKVVGEGALKEEAVKNAGFDPSSYVPNAPFKNNGWVALVLKRVLRLAAEEGYDQVGWSTGAIQSNRGELITAVDAIKWTHRTDSDFYKIIGVKDKYALFVRDRLSFSQLQEIVDKKVAANIRQHKGLTKRTKNELKGQITDNKPLMVNAARGLIEFYDQLLPNVWKKVAHRLDKSAIVTTSVLPNTFDYRAGKSWQLEPQSDRSGYLLINTSGNRLEQFTTEAEAKAALVEREHLQPVTIWTAPITDAMRVGAMQGQPLFRLRAEPASSPVSQVADNVIRLQIQPPPAPVLHDGTHLYSRDDVQDLSGETPETIRAALIEHFGPAIKTLEADGHLKIVADASELPAAAQRHTGRVDVHGEDFGQWELVDTESRTLCETYLNARGEERTRRVGDWANAEVSAGSGQPIVHIYWCRHKTTQQLLPFGSDTAAAALGLRNQRTLELKREALEAEKSQAKSVTDHVLQDAERFAVANPADAIRGCLLRNRHHQLTAKAVTVLQRGERFIGVVSATSRADTLSKHGWRKLDLPALLSEDYTVGSPDPGPVTGYFDGKTAYLVAPHLNAHRAPGVLLHEIGSHAAFPAMLGQHYGALVSEFNDLLNKKDPHAILAAALVPPDTLPENIDAERLAYLVELVANAGKMRHRFSRHPELLSLYDNLPQPARGAVGLVERVYSHLRAWLFRQPFYQQHLAPRLGRFGLKLTATDIQSLAYQGLRRWADGLAQTAPPRTAQQFSFAGELAAGADLVALDRAREMRAKGRDRGDIWQETGWFKDVDGRWKFEIDDTPTTLMRDAFYHTSKPYDGAAELLHGAGVTYDDLGPEDQEAIANIGFLSVYNTPSKVLANCPLLDHYPEADSNWLDLLIDPTTDKRFGRFHTATEDPEFNKQHQLPFTRATTNSFDDLHLILLHEMQHHIQEIEGFGRGANPRDIKNELIKLEQARMAPHVADYHAYPVAAQKLGALQRQNRIDRFRTMANMARPSSMARYITSDRDAYLLRSDIIDQFGLEPPRHRNYERQQYLRNVANYLAYHLTQQQTDDDRAIVEQARLDTRKWDSIIKAERQNLGRHLDGHCAYQAAWKRLQRYINTPAETLYKLMAGEVEARNVQYRHTLSAAERPHYPPWTTIDVDEKDIIVEFTHLGQAELFVGPKAEGVDTQALELAKKLDLQDVDREIIWQKTGWFRGVEGKWRTEINDGPAQVLRNHSDPSLLKTRDPGPLRALRYYDLLRDHNGYLSEHQELTWRNMLKKHDIAPPEPENHMAARLRHPQLFARYPAFKHASLYLGDSATLATLGHSNGTHLYYGSLHHSDIAVNQDLDDAKRLAVTLHETQHRIQAYEHWARGGSAREFKALDITADYVRELQAQKMALFERNPQYASLQRAANRAFGAICEQYGDGPRLDWDNVPDAVANPYFELLERKDAHPEACEYIELDMQIRRLLRDRVLLSPEDQYQRLAGEVEANNVVTRMQMSPAERSNTPPWETAAVAEKEQIIRYYPRQGKLLFCDAACGGADQPLLDRAKALHRQGMERGAIFRETGCFQSPDGRWCIDKPHPGRAPILADTLFADPALHRKTGAYALTQAIRELPNSENVAQHAGALIKACGKLPALAERVAVTQALLQVIDHWEQPACHTPAPGARTRRDAQHAPTAATSPQLNGLADRVQDWERDKAAVEMTSETKVARLQ